MTRNTRDHDEPGSAAVPTPLGDLTVVASASGICAILWPNDDPKRVRLRYVAGTSQAQAAHVEAARSQLLDFFDRRLTEFDLALDMRGTDFQRAVWGALKGVGYGRTSTYASIADAIGKPGSARAVGAAVGRNPVSIVVPCHRIVGSNGSLTGFAGGLDAKRFLLALEAKYHQPNLA